MTAPLSFSNCDAGVSDCRWIWLSVLVVEHLSWGLPVLALAWPVDALGHEVGQSLLFYGVEMVLILVAMPHLMTRSTPVGRWWIDPQDWICRVRRTCPGTRRGCSYWPATPEPRGTHGADGQRNRLASSPAATVLSAYAGAIVAGAEVWSTPGEVCLLAGTGHEPPMCSKDATNITSPPPRSGGHEHPNPSTVPPRLTRVEQILALASSSQQDRL